MVCRGWLLICCLEVYFYFDVCEVLLMGEVKLVGLGLCGGEGDGVVVGGCVVEVDKGCFL